MQAIEQKERRLLFAAVCVNEMIMMRMRELFHEKELLDQFTVEEFVLDSAVDYYEQFEEMPDLGILRSNMQADWEASVMESGADDDLIADERELEEIFELANTLKQRPPELLERVCNKIIDKLYEFALRNLTTREVSSRQPLLQVLSDMQGQLHAGLGGGGSRFASVFDKRRAAITGNERFIETSIPFIDSFLGGRGPISGDVIGHAAPRGAGKTTLSSQVAVEVAKRERWLSQQSAEPPKIVYVFNYEQIKDPMTQMVVNIAEIPRDTIDEYMVTFDEKILSSGKDYHDYERKKFKAAIEAAQKGEKPWPLAELSRVELAEKFISEHIALVDFTGSDPDNNALAGRYVDGIIDYISMHQKHLGNPGVSAVLIDYAGTCVRTHISMNPKLSEDRHYRSLIDDLPLRCKREVSNRFNCFVWVSQQLAADEASRAGGTRPDPNKFKGCKSFAENCDFAIVNGMPTKEGLAVFVQSKARRGKPVPDKAVKLVGQFSRWVSAESQYAIVSGRAVDRADLEMLGMGQPMGLGDTMS